MFKCMNREHPAPGIANETQKCSSFRIRAQLGFLEHRVRIVVVVTTPPAAVQRKCAPLERTAVRREHQAAALRQSLCTLSAPHRVRRSERNVFVECDDAEVLLPHANHHHTHQHAHLPVHRMPSSERPRGPREMQKHTPRVLKRTSASARRADAMRHHVASERVLNDARDLRQLHEQTRHHLRVVAGMPPAPDAMRHSVVAVGVVAGENQHERRLDRSAADAAGRAQRAADGGQQRERHRPPMAHQLEDLLVQLQEPGKVDGRRAPEGEKVAALVVAANLVERRGTLRDEMILTTSRGCHSAQRSAR
mmetsp:Transcript_42353/g.105441  ORF Transcript_42353/g.105441 Transcript_42353/m.105441 type:complete len:307 (-) Transcript_42353:122-1042(-)